MYRDLILKKSIISLVTGILNTVIKDQHMSLLWNFSKRKYIVKINLKIRKKLNSETNQK